jgi:hypothetical protein
MRLWCRCFGPGRSPGLVLGGGRLGGQFAGGGDGRRLPGWVGSESEANYCPERGERSRGEQDVIELRQVGTATGVAVFGALYASRVTTATLHDLAGLPAPPDTVHRLAAAVASGAGTRVPIQTERRSLAPRCPKAKGGPHDHHQPAP